MNRAMPILVFILMAVMAGCGGKSKQSNDDFITVDVTKRYPKKELILQDIFEVEYIPLETTDDFITSSSLQYFGKDIIVTRNIGRDGNYFLFARNGNGLRKINRMGQGPEEHLNAGSIALDEDNDEMFVNDTAGEKIYVYDLFGKFKYFFRYPEFSRIETIYRLGIFDRDNLICHLREEIYVPIHDGRVDDSPKNLFYIISKHDGSITKEIQIPHKKRLFTRPNPPGERYAAFVYNEKLIPFRDSWVIAEHSADTIYRFLPDHSLIPFIVRTPSINSMDPEVFLFLSVLTDRYYFMQTVKKEFDFATYTGYPKVDLAYDIQEKSIVEYTVYNDDFSFKKQVNLGCEPGVLTLINNNEIAFVSKLESYEIVEAYEKGQLKGKLKEIAAGLNAESNPVIMVAKHKR